MSDIDKTLLELLAVAQLQIQKVSVPGGSLVICASATPLGGGGGHEHLEPVESGDEEAALRKVLLELQRKVAGYGRPKDYPRAP